MKPHWFTSLAFSDDSLLRDWLSWGRWFSDLRWRVCFWLLPEGYCIVREEGYDCVIRELRAFRHWHSLSEFGSPDGGKEARI